MPCVVATSTGLAFLRESKLEDRTTLKEVVIYGTDEVADAWGAWGVAPQGGLTGKGVVTERRRLGGDIKGIQGRSCR